MPRREQEPERFRERKLTREELLLWQRVTQDDALLPHALWVEAEGEEKPVLPVAAKEEAALFIPEKTQPQRPASLSHEVNHRQLKRFKSGAVGIDAVLDLHGKGESDARFAFYAFLENALASGHRCVLVITGKGREYTPSLFERQGRLKTLLPEWVRNAPMAASILRLEQAKPRHGGEGAYYLLLRRKR